MEMDVNTILQYIFSTVMKVISKTKLADKWKNCSSGDTIMKFSTSILQIPFF